MKVQYSRALSLTSLNICGQFLNVSRVDSYQTVECSVGSSLKCAYPSL